MSDRATAGTDIRILIAEDEMLVAEDLAISLESLGYIVIAKVSTGEQAVAMAESSSPDLILMDIKLAGAMDGIEAADKIRSLFDIPVVYLTGYSEEDVIERAKLTEPYGFLAKPISVAELRSTVETVLHRYEADRKLRESEERYRSLVEQSIDGIVVVQGTAIRFVNPALLAMFGCRSEQEMVGDSYLKFVAPEHREL